METLTDVAFEINFNLHVLKSHILFAHAVLGCNITSCLLGIRKDVAVNKLETELYFREQAKWW